MKKFFLLFILLLPVFSRAQHTSSRDTGIYYIDGERIPGTKTPHKTVSREDIQKVPLSGKSVELYRPLKICKWWQWRKKRRLRKQLKHMI